MPKEEINKLSLEELVNFPMVSGYVMGVKGCFQTQGRFWNSRNHFSCWNVSFTAVGRNVSLKVDEKILNKLYFSSPLSILLKFFFWFPHSLEIWLGFRDDRPKLKVMKFTCKTQWVVQMHRGDKTHKTQLWHCTGSICCVAERWSLRLKLWAGK